MLAKFSNYINIFPLGVPTAQYYRLFTGRHADRWKGKNYSQTTTLILLTATFQLSIHYPLTL
jgi:hypothetical protein